ncbi:MAG: hypothetical protein RLZZ148_1292 [Cyanobacteriota bacterium]|jgi:hypothetical protein
MIDDSSLELLTEVPLTTIKNLAQEHRQDPLALLLILRLLEQLHREIREEIFEPSLPNIRNDLYNLLRDIEESGGWPYIERMKLKTLMLHFFPEETTPQTQPHPTENPEY